jgi:hypothetical protein
MFKQILPNNNESATEIFPGNFSDRGWTSLLQLHLLVARP